MSMPLFILQAAMAAGLFFIYGGALLFFGCSIGFTAMYFRFLKQKNFKYSTKKQQTILLYSISLILGILTALLTVAVFWGIILFFFGNTSLD